MNTPLFKDLAPRSSAEAHAALLQTLDLMSQAQLATALGKHPRTVSRWVHGDTPTPPLLFSVFRNFVDQGKRFSKGAFRFADLFAGVGGIRIGFEAQGGDCVFTCEWNKFSQQTYRANFRDHHEIFGDITKIVDPANDIPDFDVLLGGFPCQPFSIAGVSKKNALGRPHGFACETQGTLFFDVARIIAAKQPRAFLLENVKNLISHDKGQTFRVIRRVLTEELGYSIAWKVIDGQHFVPQHRERILIVGFREPVPFDWNAVALKGKGMRRLDSILHREDGSERAEEPYTEGRKATVSARYTLTDNLWRYLRDYAAKHRAAGNGFGYGLVGRGDIARTLSARYFKDGSEILVSRGEGKNPRRLTPRECARLMGFPDRFKIPVSDTQAYRQFGNSVVVPVMAAVAEAMRPFIVRTATGDTSAEQLSLFSAASGGVARRPSIG